MNHVVRKTVNPSSAPSEAGIHWINVTTGQEFFSVGISTISDWIPRSEGNVPIGGLSNQVLVKDTDSDYDFSWQTLDKSDVGLDNVDNTSDTNKPVSTATQTALNLKENSIAAGTTGQYWRGDKSWQTLDKSAVGLGNVDNTSDANKPVSTATQAALDLKYDASNPSSFETTTQLNTRDTNNRARANHTGTQLASTISDFASQVIAQVLTGFAVGSKVTVAATDTILAAFEKVQAYLNVMVDRTISNTYTAGAKQIFSPDATTAGLNVGAVSSDPSSVVNGDIWLNSTSGEISFRSNGLTLTLAGPINAQLITSGTTYTPLNASVKRVVIEGIGGGGGGGGCSSAAAAAAAGGGGGAGSYFKTGFVSLTGAASYTLAIGAGGTAGANTGGNGGNGGTTTITIGATTYTAAGGIGGAGMVQGTGALFSEGGSSGAIATNGLINASGMRGHWGIRINGTTAAAGMGGVSAGSFGSDNGGARVAVGGSLQSTSRGGGGGGGIVVNGSAAVTGGIGQAGGLIIWEYL